MWGISCSMYNLKHLKWGLQVPLTLLSHAQSEVERRLGSRSARGCATELGLFLLPWHCRLAPSSICSFGTYSCNDYEQSLIKLQRTLPRNQCVSVYRDDHLLSSFSVCGWVWVCVCVFLYLLQSEDQNKFITNEDIFGKWGYFGSYLLLQRVKTWF